MKVCINEQYGSPDNLRYSEIDTPLPGKGEVRIKIHALSINGSDLEGLSGKPLYARIGGFRKPKHPIRGSDIAGTVDAVGELHTEFKVGDKVFGELADYHGGFAEYVCTDAQHLTHMPNELSFEQAAALPQAGVIAYNGICKMESIQPGQKVLINGAGGSSGSFAIQLAKTSGAEVTGVDNHYKLEFLQTLGADHVIDHEKCDFTQGSERYDLILDLIAQRPAMNYARVLGSGGRYALVGGSVSTMLQVLALGPVVKLLSGKTLRVLAVPQCRTDLLAVSKLVTSGKLNPAIDRLFPFSEIPDAMRYVLSGKSKGKIVIRMHAE